MPLDLVFCCVPNLIIGSISVYSCQLSSFIFSRAVYDGDDVDQFQDKLEDRIKLHDREIERMCNYHYQGFIDSVRELQQVGGDAGNLKVMYLE